MSMAADAPGQLMEAIPNASFPKKKTQLPTAYIAGKPWQELSAPQETGHLLLQQQQTGKFSVLHKIIPYIPAVPQL